MSRRPPMKAIFPGRRRAVSGLPYSVLDRVRVLMIYPVSGPSPRERIAASANTPRLIRVTAPLAANRPNRTAPVTGYNINEQPPVSSIS